MTVSPSQPASHQPDSLLAALARLASMQREAVDRLALQEAVAASTGPNDPVRRLQLVAEKLQVRSAKWRDSPDASDLPALLVSPAGAWAVLKARNANGQWIGEQFDTLLARWSEHVFSDLKGYRFASLHLVPPYKATRSPVWTLVVDEIKAHKGRLFEGVVGGALITFFGVMVSFYTIQIYDRVIPTGATQTLMVLTLGIVMVVGMEYAAKRLRSRVYEHLVDLVDQRLARTVYLRFLSVRLDQMPQSVGTLASQLRGYETVRGFLVNLSAQLAVDAPFALIFVAVIWFIAGPLALVPLFFFVVALLVGAWHGARIRALTERSQEAANRKTGLLVETVEGAEIIKSGQGGVAHAWPLASQCR